MSISQVTFSGQKRYAELDGLRGIAALSVVVWHFFCATYTIPEPNVKAFLYSLYFLVHGRAAVLLFFILSGFVLSLSFFKEPRQRYARFVFRRICRIYLPYLALIVFAIIVRTFLTTRSIPGLSDWFNDYNGDPFSLKTALEHMFLIGNIHSNVYNNAIWSLIHEMRISLVFPFIFIFVKRVHPAISIASCFVLSAIAWGNDVFNWETSNGWESGYFYSLHVTSFFIIGILLARYQDKLTKLYRHLNKPLKIVLFIVCILLFRVSMEVWTVKIKLLLLSDYGTALGACGFMVIALGSPKVSNILKTSFFNLIGNISYSIYLNHITVIYIVFFTLYPLLSLPVLLVVVLATVIAVSYLTWKFIELPSIALGRIVKRN